MAHLAFVEMGKHWKVGVHGVKQPEVSNVRGGEIRQALILLAPASGKLRTAGGEQFDQTTQQSHQVFACADLDERWNEPGIELKRARRSPFHVGDAQHRRTFAVFRVRQQTHILSRDLDGLLAGAGVLVAKGGHFRQVASASVFAGGDIETALAVVGNRQVNVQTLRPRLEKFFQGFGRWWRIRFWNLEQQSIGKDACGTRNNKLTIGQQLSINRQFAEAPGTKLECLQAEIERILDEAILHLEMLRGQERTLGPENWF